MYTYNFLPSYYISNNSKPQKDILPFTFFIQVTNPPSRIRTFTYLLH